MNVAIILAAGESRRMGEPKQLLPFGDKTMLQCVIDAFDSPKIDQTLVVLGYKADDIAQRITATVVRNPNHARGMFTSVQAGLRALPKKAKLVLIAVGDQPRLKRATVEKLVETFERKKHKLLIPSIHGRQGHPLLLSARYVNEILVMDGTLTLKHFLANHPDDIARLVVDDEGVLVDIDTPADYRRVVGRVSPRGAGTRNLPRRLRRLSLVWAGEGHPRYFLTLCVQGRRPLLADDRIHTRLKSFLVASPSHYGWCPSRYVLMPDHLHLLVAGSPQSKSLGEWVKAMKAIVGGGEIRWQRGFFDHVLRSEESESEKWEYIRQNPVRAGLVGRAEDWMYAGEVGEPPNAASGDAAYK